jgi:hypothetical protein
MTAHPATLDRHSQKEGHMFDRDRFLASDHEARLLAEAESRRLTTVVDRRSRRDRSPLRRARLAVSLWLVGTGRRLDAGSDPCGPETRLARS